MRIAIIGYSGAGKSHSSQGLRGNGTPARCCTWTPCTFFRVGRSEATGTLCPSCCPGFRRKSWVIDGNYGSLAYWERMELADQIIFFQFQPVPMPLASL